MSWNCDHLEYRSELNSLLQHFEKIHQKKKRKQNRFILKNLPRIIHLESMERKHIRLNFTNCRPSWNFCFFFFDFLLKLEHVFTTVFV